MPIRTGDYQSVDLVVRGAIPATALAAGVRAALRNVDPNLPTIEFRTMEQLVDRSVFARRFTVLLVAGFAAFGLILSCLGIYAVISYSVSQRTQEIGIRMALGATPARLRTTIFGETGVLVVLGVILGVPASWMASRAIRGCCSTWALGPRDVRGRAGGHVRGCRSRGLHAGAACDAGRSGGRASSAVSTRTTGAEYADGASRRALSTLELEKARRLPRQAHFTSGSTRATSSFRKTSDFMNTAKCPPTSMATNVFCGARIELTNVLARLVGVV